MVQSSVGESDINVIEEEEKKLSVETRKYMKEFPNLFLRSGSMKNHKVKIRTRDEAKITQQEGRKIPIEMQNVVDKKK